MLDALDVPAVSSTATVRHYFAQAFASASRSRHAVVLDAAFAVDGFDPWAHDDRRDRAAWSTSAHGQHLPGGDPVASSALAGASRTPLTGRGGRDGARHPGG